MAWDRGSQDSLWRELERTDLVGEDQPLYPDLPELDLSELDVSADGFLGGLKWYSDQSEIISSPYGNESSSLFEENEANLLAVLTETLDSIPVGDDALPSFHALSEGGVAKACDQGRPDYQPHSPAQFLELDEPSLLKKLLLAPASSELSYAQHTGDPNPNPAPKHAASSLSKAEDPGTGGQGGVAGPQPSRAIRRPCAELLRYLTSGNNNDDGLQTKAQRNGKEKSGGASSPSSSSPLSSSSTSSTFSTCSSSSSASSSSLSFYSSSSSSSSSEKKPSPLHHHRRRQRANPSTLPLPLTPESPNDHKESPFENKTIERTLSVELSGTPGLTPPTTPPHKDSQSPFRATIKPKVSSRPPSSSPANRRAGCSAAAAPCPLALGPARKDPRRSELYAQLRRTSALPQRSREGRRPKRPALRIFGDHDYCQASADTAVPPCMSRPGVRCTVLAAEPSSSSSSTGLQGGGGDQSSPTRKALRDQEIRAELNKHFGLASQAVRGEGTPATAPPAGREDRKPPGCPSPCEEESDGFLFPWEDLHLDLLFKSSSPSCSLSSCSLSPPTSRPSPQHRRWSRSRSKPRSHRRTPQRSHSRSSCSRSRSRSPYSRSSSRSRHHVDSSSRRPRAHRSPHNPPRPQSPTSSTRRTRYDCYEEYQQECLKREVYRRDYEKREHERAEQRERQSQKAIEERRVVYIGRLRSDITRTELKRRFEVFGGIEECTVNLRDDGDNFGFITYRYTCDAAAALESGHTLRRPTEPKFEMCPGGRKQYCMSTYTDLDSHSEDFDPASTKSKYDSLDFDSLLQEAQRSLRR